MDKFDVVYRRERLTKVVDVRPGGFFIHEGVVLVRHHMMPSERLIACTAFYAGLSPSPKDLPYNTPVQKINVSLTLEVTDTCAD